MLSGSRVKAILDGEDPRFGRGVAFAIQALIAVSIVSVAIETLPRQPSAVRRVLVVEEWIVVPAFSAEYLARLYAAPKPLRYAVSFFGIVDLLAVLPTLLLLGTDMRALRVLRTLRILRLLKLMRNVNAVDRLGAALGRVADELIVFAGIAVVVLYLCATAIYHFEHEAQPEAFASIPHAMWWEVVTFTTVGYGDVTPVTAGGRVFTGLVLILALGVIAVPTGLIATALSSELRKPRRSARPGEPEHSGDPVPPGEQGQPSDPGRPDPPRRPGERLRSSAPQPEPERSSDVGGSGMSGPGG